MIHISEYQYITGTEMIHFCIIFCQSKLERNEIITKNGVCVYYDQFNYY